MKELRKDPYKQSSFFRQLLPLYTTMWYYTKVNATSTEARLAPGILQLRCSPFYSQFAMVNIENSFCLTDLKLYKLVMNPR